MRRPVLSPVLALALLLGLGACTSVQVPTGDGDGASLLDSLRAENVRLRDQNRSLRDSLRFRADVETGQYYRDLRTLQDRLTRLSYEVRLLREGGLTVAVLPADSLFATAADSLSAAGTERLRALSRQLQAAYPDRTVRVEGHADSAPLGASLRARYASNWGLSTARATTVVRRLIALTDLDRSQFVAVGYGASRPRASNDTAAGRRRNRRVRVAVLPLPQTYSRPFEVSW
jgi:chemotaxis protein MotB